MAIDIAAYVYYGRPALTASYYDGYGLLEALCPDGMAVIPDTLCVRGLATGSVSTVGGGGGRVTQLGYDAEGRVALTQAFYGGRAVVEETAYTLDGRMGRRTVTAMGGRQRCAHGGVRIQL